MAWEYAPAPESRELVRIAPEYGLFVDGTFVPAAGGHTFTTVNPASEEPLAEVAAASPADVDRAVKSPRGALLLSRWMGRQARACGIRPGAAPARGRGPSDPVELPVADGRVEARAGARGGQHLRAEARGDHAAVRVAACGGLPAGRTAAGRREHRHRRRLNGGGSCRSSRVGQGGFHRLDGGGQEDQAGSRGHGKEAHPGTRREGGKRGL